MRFPKNSLLFCENRHERQGERCVALEGRGAQISIDAGEPLRMELKAFLDSMKNRSKPLADGQAGYEALKIVEACYESSRKWRRVEITPHPFPLPDWGEGKVMDRCNY